MAFKKVSALDDLWQGEMKPVQVDGVHVLLVHTEAGQLCAVQAHCPHHGVALERGELEGAVLTCQAHRWQFDVTTGKGVNPANAEIARYPVKVESEDILVDVEGVTPKVVSSD